MATIWAALTSIGVDIENTVVGKGEMRHLGREEIIYEGSLLDRMTHTRNHLRTPLAVWLSVSVKATSRCELRVPLRGCEYIEPSLGVGGYKPALTRARRALLLRISAV